MSDIRWRQALPTGIADALIWVWFLQTAYLSRFTEQLPLMGAMAQAMPYLSIAVCLILSLLLMLLRWDAIPAAYRITCSLLATVAPSTMLALQVLGFGNGVVAIIAYLIFVAAYYGSQILRIETLAKCPNVRTLVMALITSLAAYYGISFVLLVVPVSAYNTIVVAAPLALLYRTWRPLSPLAPSALSAKHRWKRILLSGPTVLLVLFGISGGLISAHGGSNPALTLTGLFRMPDPAHLVMVLANMALGILAARTLQAPRGTYFALLSILWMSGSFLGAFLIRFLPPIPEIVFMVLAGIVAMAIVASFVVDGELWVLPESRPAETDASTTNSEGLSRNSLASLAQAAALTPRETEIFAILAEGRSVPVICERLTISEGTARTHVKHIYQKLNVHNRQELLDLTENRQA